MVAIAKVGANAECSDVIFSVDIIYTRYLDHIYYIFNINSAALSSHAFSLVLYWYYIRRSNYNPRALPIHEMKILNSMDKLSL